MQKIMFNDKYGLTAAVLARTKTQTRRIVPQKAIDAWNDIDDGDEYSRSVYAASYEAKMRKFLLEYARFKVGEVVAVAQSYFDIKTSANSYRPPFWKGYKDWHKYLESLPTNGGGCYNKMFVRAELMPHQIEITGIRVERLQDISDDDCMAEGIIKYANGVYTYTEDGKKIFRSHLDTPRKAYAELIDKISGVEQGISPRRRSDKNEPCNLRGSKRGLHRRYQMASRARQVDARRKRREHNSDGNDRL